ncbi:MAG: aspartate carbamoyltransferase, partial [Candidatus Atribacteria bacterium]|nr:aspartate carbamoyltransferase [Candidatus Atribacteria bacterium]
MLKGKDVINTAQFSLQELGLIMDTAANFEEQVKNGKI